ncbi:MAG TPA: hypothetical protein VK550_04160 [Polyangiaceae bacterium]|nr:hypothetical protein [Polyangiaceae bacterium]
MITQNEASLPQASARPGAPVQDGTVDMLLTFADSLSTEERTALRSLMCVITQQVCPAGEFPSDPVQLARFRQALMVLGTIQRHPRMTSNGVIYRGRPAFLTDDFLTALQREANEEVRPRAIWQRGHMLGVSGTLADKLAMSPEMQTLIEQASGPINATGVASYLFYEVEGAGVSAHVDTEVFSINVSIMLRHEGIHRRSRLFIFNMDGMQREDIELVPGEMIVTFGDSIVHGRSPLAAGELVNIVTFGYQPANWVA